MCSGREFQIWVAATGKARLPMVDSLNGGTTSQLVLAERSARRSGTSAVEVNGPRYCVVSLCMSTWLSRIEFALVHAANVDWRVHPWCDQSAWDRRWAVPQLSELIAVCAAGRLECQPACYSLVLRRTRSVDAKMSAETKLGGTDAAAVWTISTSWCWCWLHYASVNVGLQAPDPTHVDMHPDHSCRYLSICFCRSTSSPGKTVKCCTCWEHSKRGP